jgi:AraC-like DNA-binding protein
MSGWWRDPGLGPEQIARAHFYSPRYVHKLFAEDGSGVSAWIRKQRMERALADLRRPSDDTVAAIALRWGYRDAASFSRAFRQTYGCSPQRSSPRALNRIQPSDPSSGMLRATLSTSSKNLSLVDL